jgi:acyl-CoA thioester hydrolase
VSVSGDITIRVRYAETDRMGLLHHANYLVYFEQGRIELLRSRGLTYKDLEDQGFLLVLTKLEVKYRAPARYDDLLTLRTTVERTTAVRIDHRYELLRDGVLLAEAHTTLACITRDGRVQPLPESLQGERGAVTAWVPLPGGLRPPLAEDSENLIMCRFIWLMLAAFILSSLGCGRSGSSASTSPTTPASTPDTTPQPPTPNVK